MAHAPIALPFNRAPARPRVRAVSLPPRMRGPKPLTPPSALDKPPVANFVLLSMLLHLFAILVFGAPSGGSREGRAMWGALRVTLLEAPRETPPALKVERELALLPTPLPRERTRVRPAPPPKPIDLGIARKLEQAPVVVPRVIDRIVKPEPAREEPPPLVLPPPTEAQVVAPTPVAPIAPIAPPAEAAVVEAPAPPPPLPPPTRVERPAEAPPVAAPLVQPVPPPPIPQVERPPVEVQSIPVPRLESVAPPRIEPRIEPEARPLERTPAEERSVAPPAPPPAERVQPAPPPAPPKPVERAVPREEPTLQPSPFRPAPSVDKPFPRGSEQPSSNYDPTAPSVDLDAARRRAGQLAREGTGNRALLPFAMPPVPKPKSKLETAIENARKPDCKTAYKDMGLLAVVPLIANEFGEGNCKW
ncbi:MAG TPA: hypothetical protein VM122_04350 [Usitatibacter sp.]|nr:hypothetical protein [Usitatibacter sp.]